MFKCKRCNSEFKDGVQCTVCRSRLDFQCAGITEAGYKKLGDRKNAWKCLSCKSLASSKEPSPLPPGENKSPVSTKSSVPVDADTIFLELRRLTEKISVLPELVKSINTIKEELESIKSIQLEFTQFKNSLEFMHNNVESLSSRVTKISEDVNELKKTNAGIPQLQSKISLLEAQNREFEQRSRLNNIEIKGVPVSTSEDLFKVFSKICDHVNFKIPKEQINYIARVPMRNDKQNKTILISIHNRYIKDDFISAARKCVIMPADLGMRGDHRIYVNEHLTVENKLLLNKTKSTAKEKGFSYTWVKGCKIFVRKNPSAHIICIKSELDLKKL